MTDRNEDQTSPLGVILGPNRMLYRCVSTGLVLLREPTFFTCTLCGPR
jgi:hypothetical protein